MKKSIQIGYDDLFEQKCHFAADAGFRHIAVNYTTILGRNEDEWKAITEDIRRILDETGISCIQSHPHYYDLLLSSEIINDDMEFAIRQSIISSAALGAEYCVIHPRTATSFAYGSKKSFEDNRKWFTELLECAVKHGTKIAAENLPIFPSELKVMPFYSSNIDDLTDLVDSFNDENLVICWDTGHANMLEWDQATAIKHLGNRIKCTHIHNNYGYRDDHSTPDIGSIEWDKVMPAFASIGYDGPLTLETHCWYDDPDLRASFAKHNFACLEYLEKLAKKEN